MTTSSFEGGLSGYNHLTSVQIYGGSCACVVEYDSSNKNVRLYCNSGNGAGYDQVEIFESSQGTVVGTVVRRPGEQHKIGQGGAVSAIFSYEYDGVHGGHVSGHHATYNGGMPKEFVCGDGESLAVTFGQACGLIYERIVFEFSGGEQIVIVGEIMLIEEDGLVDLPDSPNYYKIGGRDRHPSNHWGAACVVDAITLLAKEYRDATGEKLYINDMSLVWGGLFDINGDWKPPHHEHRRGRSVDVAATEETLPYEVKFLMILRQITTDYIVEGAGSKRHYHIRF